MSEVCLNLPFNSVSFGQLGVALAREAYNRNLNPAIFPHGQVDLSAQGEDAGFQQWLEKRLNQTMVEFDSNNHDTSFKLWHLNPESYFRTTAKQNLLSFYELDSPTNFELNVVKNNNITYFTSEYTVEKFKEFGASNVKYLPLFFDSFNFKQQKDKTYYSDKRITFNLVGKFEKRKSHAEVLKAWAKKYGNKKKYYLNCAIYNPFLTPQQNQAVIQGIFGNNQPFNVNFIGHMPTNSVYNEYLNSADIVIGMSGGEGWGLPEFQSVAMGKHSVILDCNGYKSWATPENSVLVQPSKKISAVDGVHFHENGNTNQGSIFTFEEDAFIDGCEKALERYRNKKENLEGLKLQEQFTVSNTFDIILKDLQQ